MPPTLPSSSRCPATGAVRHTVFSDTDSSTSSAIDDQAAFVNSNREDEDSAAAQFKEDRTTSPRSPEVVGDLEDEPMGNSVCLDTTNGYHNGAGSSGPTCRICHEGDQEAELVSPCSCSGTIGFVHVSCLEHWLNERNVDLCELCGERFQMAAQPITVLRLLRWVWQNKKWLWQSLLYDLLCLVVGMLVVALVCVLPATLVAYGKSVRWVVGIFYLVGIVLLVTYVVLTLDSLRARYCLFMVRQSAHSMRRIVLRGPPE
ncbi:hypothetical protein MTO96_018153 [Rhipicephalus appendiculatus]